MQYGPNGPYGLMWFLEELFKAMIKILVTFYIVVGIVIVVALAATILGLIFFTKVTLIILLVLFSIVFVIVAACFCQGSGLGNTYCPNCGSEDNAMMSISDNNVSRMCNACGHFWEQKS